MDVEWDEAKRLSNLAQRGVDFADAALIFEGAVIEAEDRRAASGERRFRAPGQVDDEFYIVAYTWRDQNRRIVSAWKVDDEGRRRSSALLSRGA